MIYNLYEIADLYKVSRQYVQRKYREFKSNREETGKQLEETKKDERMALKNNDLIDFVSFLGYDHTKLTGNRKATEKQPTGNQEATEKQPKGNPEETKNKDEMIRFLQEQLKKKDDQLDSKDNIIQQQNSIIMATQKNMNDLLQQHNELKYTSSKKEDLIKQLEYDREKTESSVKAIAKLERTIDDALMEKRLRDGIEFSKQLMKEKKNLK